ncbi:MAG: hypothetical protein ACYC9W_09695, partial [Candidatus Limnocylindria bacterium]
VASLAAFPSWPLEWARELLTHRVEIARPMPTAWGLSVLLFGGAVWGAVLLALVVAVVLVVARGRRVDGVAFGAIVLAISLFATPYVGGYDQLFLAPSWAVVLAAAARSAPRRRRVLLGAVVAVAVVVPWSLLVLFSGSGSDTPNALVPALSAVLATAAQPRLPHGGEGRTRAGPPLPA